MYALFLAWKCMHTYTRLLIGYPACIRDLVNGEPAYNLFVYTTLYIVNLCVYAAWSMVNLCLPFFLHYLLFTYYIVIFHLRELTSRTTLVSYLYHNANNLPLWTWWKQPRQVTLPLWHQGKRADQDILSLDIHSVVHTPLEYMLKSLIELPLCTC